MRADFGEDVDRLRRRFDAFLGLSAAGEEISTGFDRLGRLVSAAPESIESWNQSMLRRAADMEKVRSDWYRSVGAENNRRDRLIRELSVPSILMSSDVIVESGVVETSLFARLRRWWMGRRIQRMASAVAAALEEQKPSDGSAAKVRIRWCEGSWVVSLVGAGQQSQWLFVDTLSEVFDLLATPRYVVLHRRDRCWAVPGRFGKNVAKATRYSEIWRRKVGRHRLLFGGSKEGREHLARAKERALLEYFELRPRVRTKWDQEE